MTARDRMFVLTADEMRAADAAAVAAGTPVATLMERAGAGAVRAIEDRFGTVHGFRVHVVCGKGNNGGDGFVVARLLAARGAHVEVRLVAGVPADGAAREHYDELDGAGVRMVDAPPARPADIVVDAVLGTGARGALPDAFANALRAALAASPGALVVALDLPTGLDADTGRPLSPGGYVVPAGLTIAFAHLKPAHVLFPGRAACGAIAVADIGIEPVSGTRAVELTTAELAASLLPKRAPDAHKGDAGRVLVVGGSAGLTGAVVLASMSALRAGAGLVTAAVPRTVNASIEAAMIEPMSWPLEATANDALAASNLGAILERAKGAQVVALGPGLSRDPDAAKLAREVVTKSETTVVLDADGLNAFAGLATGLARAHRRAALVVTPHLGEMSRLTGRGAEELEAERLTVAAAYAKEWAAVVVLKGAPTVVASPEGAVAVNPTGNPGMATAGMGDVLTGTIAAFVAQGVEPFDAARLGVYVHGLAADLAHARVGTLGLVAGDVTAALPQAISRLEPAETRSHVVHLPEQRLAPVPPDHVRSLSP